MINIYIYGHHCSAYEKRWNAPRLCWRISLSPSNFCFCRGSKSPPADTWRSLKNVPWNWDHMVIWYSEIHQWIGNWMKLGPYHSISISQLMIIKMAINGGLDLWDNPLDLVQVIGCFGLSNGDRHFPWTTIHGLLGAWFFHVFPPSWHLETFGL